MMTATEIANLEYALAADAAYRAADAADAAIAASVAAKADKDEAYPADADADADAAWAAYDILNDSYYAARLATQRAVDAAFFAAEAAWRVDATEAGNAADDAAWRAYNGAV